MHGCVPWGTKRLFKTADQSNCPNCRRRLLKSNFRQGSESIKQVGATRPDDNKTRRSEKSLFAVVVGPCGRQSFTKIMVYRFLGFAGPDWF